jgi:hypothetical protein
LKEFIATEWVAAVLEAKDTGLDQVLLSPSKKKICKGFPLKISSSEGENSNQ